MPAPTDVTGVRRFLGMARYLGKYVDGFSAMCEPLRKLTKEDVVWDWNFEQGTAFKKIKESLVKAPVLAFFDERQDTTLQCDASQTALGAALLQNGRPAAVAYTNRALLAAECNYAQIEKELLAVVFGMEHFDHFTYGREIRVESDHKPLQAIKRSPSWMRQEDSSVCC